MASVELENVGKAFGKVDAIRDVSLRIGDGEFVVFVGPSGCGKSTLLRMIAGIETIGSGELRIGTRRMNETNAADRGVAMVFQSYALYPHMTVRENMGFGLKMSGIARDEVARKVADAAAILQIEELLDRRPRALSGGQRQRVAIGRAIVRSPDVFLFDEPLSNLDAGLRVQMRVEIGRLHRDLATTMIYVTHDQVEAMTLADRIVVLNGGRIEQEGLPIDLYERPANLFVAAFLGQPRMNFIPVHADEGGLRLASGARLISLDVPPSRDPALTLGIRPDGLAPVPAETAELKGRVDLIEHLGAETLIHVRLDNTGGLVTVALKGKHSLPLGGPLGLCLDPKSTHLFRADGRRLE